MHRPIAFKINIIIILNDLLQICSVIKNNSHESANKYFTAVCFFFFLRVLTLININIRDRLKIIFIQDNTIPI